MLVLVAFRVLPRVVASGRAGLIRSPVAAMLCPPLLLAVILASTTFAAPTTPRGGAAMRFEVKTPKRTQELKVAPTTDSAVSFELTMGGDCQRTITGEANLRRGSPRILKDEKGRSYPAEEFVYLLESCGLVLRIKAQDAGRASVAKAGTCHEICPPLPDIMFRADDTSQRKRKKRSPAIR